MFTVPGWSISADSLRAQTAVSGSDSVALTKEGPHAGGAKGSKKRKRGHWKNVDVTGENLGELWTRCFEGKTEEKKEEKPGGIDEGRKRKRKNQGENTQVQDEHGGEAHNGTLQVGEKENGMDLGLMKNEVAENISRQSGLSKIDPPPSASKEVPKDDDGRAKYERRKAKAERKREQRALKQANGELPPPRPEAHTQGAASKTQIKRAKKAKNAENAAANHIATQPNGSDLTKAHVNPVGHTHPTTTPSAMDTLPQNTTTTTTTQPKLTPLQAKMATKLTSARFRHLNETLYTTPSSASLSLFTSNPSAYTSYHAGFRAQVAVWPSNPIDDFIADVRARGAVRAVGRHGHGHDSQAKAFRAVKRGEASKAKKRGESEATTSSPLQPLPLTNGTCTIADLGCGDAKLAGSLLPLTSSSSKPPKNGPPLNLNLRIQSLDLARGDGPFAHLVTVADTASAADLSRAGVRPGSVDVAICCLSLMSTNWVGVVEQCARAVRWGGEVWVAEIRSRFVGKGKGKRLEAGRRGGMKGQGKKKQRGAQEDEEVDDNDDDEIDDAGTTAHENENGNGNETDLAPFIAVWQKRGFALLRNPDVSNKMFVKMWFVKEKTKSAGVGGDGETAAATTTTTTTGVRRKKKFIEKDDDGAEDDEEEEEEGKVLKPCLYKTR